MSSKNLRIVFFGTPAFAVPALERLIASTDLVCGVVSQPDRAKGRGRRELPSPVSRVALDCGLPLLRPERVNQKQVVDQLHELKADLGIVVAFGQFLGKKVREFPKLGYLVNVHASLLPKYRGAAPIAHAILKGDVRTGIALMKVEREMDAGPIALMQSLAILPEETAGELTDRLADLAAHGAMKFLDSIRSQTTHWTEQDHEHATLAPKISAADAELNFSKSSEELVRHVRAMSPKPGAFAKTHRGIVRILLAQSLPSSPKMKPGVISIGGNPVIRISTASGWLVPLRLQRSGGRVLDAKSFYHGRGLADGEEFIPHKDATKFGDQMDPDDG